MKLLSFLRGLKKSFFSYSPLVEVLISKSNLIGNLSEYKRQYPGFLFAPVLKSNAYGHGLVETAKILDKEKVPFFAVDSLYEARVLRANGIKSDILIIGYVRPEDIKGNKLPQIAFVVSSREQLEKIAEITKSKTRIHLKIDTGMRRQGILPEEAGKAAEIIKKSEFLKLEGICSHFADADNADTDFSEKQIEKWNGAVSFFEKEFQNIRFIHVSATAGVRFLDRVIGNTVRLGIGLYGINPSPRQERGTSFKKGGIIFSPEKPDLKPVLEMRSIITSVKTIKKGDCVGYGCTYRADKEMKIATVPVGYFEGADRRLSNRGFFQVDGKYCQIIGKVSMNITSIDVADVIDVKPGDKVVIISNNKNDKNSVENIANLAKTIPYEILIHIPQHLRRMVY